VHPALLHRSLRLLAVIAMLLIVLAPLVSRWMAHGGSPAPGELVHALPASAAAQPQPHHGSHHQHGDGHAPEATLSNAYVHPAAVAEPVEQPLHRAHQTQHAHESHPAQHTQHTQHPHEAHDHGGAAGQDPHAGHDMGVDCDYCLIAARMVSLLVAVLLALIAWQAPHFARTGALPWHTRIAVGHLGARGPPQPA